MYVVNELFIIFLKNKANLYPGGFSIFVRLVLVFIAPLRGAFKIG